ncbi:MAG: CNNM domain-containing protein [Gammaproteobacteria bacterium]
MDSYTLVWLLLALVFLIIGSGFFSGSEVGMMALNRYRLRHLVRQKHRTACVVNKLLQRPERLLGVILIGNTFANILASSLATILTIKIWGESGVAIATILLTLVVLIFAEIAPKTLAASNPQRLAFFAAWPLTLLLKFMYPFVWFSNVIASGFLALFGIKVHVGTHEHLSGEELRSVLYESGSLIPTEHKNMLLSILELEKVTVNDIMIPRTEIVGIDLADDEAVIIEQLRSSQHTRLPIYRDNIENIQGMLHVRQVLNLSIENELIKDNLIKAAREPYFIPEHTPLNTQLLNFQHSKTRTALVVDEYGDIQGLVTLEDILEEIVGEFTTDVAAVNPEVYPQNDGSFLVDGSASLREINRDFGWEFPVDGPKTLSGLIIEYLEFIPRPGTCLRIAGYPMEVVQIKDNMVKTAQIFPDLRKLPAIE